MDGSLQPVRQTQHRKIFTPGPARLILLSGPFRSGSTWTFNCLQELAREAGLPCIGFYGDDVSPDLRKALRRGDVAIVKSHRPSAALMEFTAGVGGTMILTTRDPRDCAASLMTQFRYSFYRALADVKRSCDAALCLKLRYMPVQLRYEDGFTSRLETLSLLCAQAGFAVSATAQRQIFAALSPSAVKRKIASYMQEGVFDGSEPDRQFHSQTHWHPNHVGDGAVQKYKILLRWHQRLALFLVNPRFFWEFRYFSL